VYALKTSLEQKSWASRARAKLPQRPCEWRPRTKKNVVHAEISWATVDFKKKEPRGNVTKKAEEHSGKWFENLLSDGQIHRTTWRQSPFDLLVPWSRDTQRNH